MAMIIDKKFFKNVLVNCSFIGNLLVATDIQFLPWLNWKFLSSAMGNKKTVVAL